MSSIVVPPRTRGLIFDCDGTLARTHHLHQEAWDECLDALGIKTPPLFLDNYKGVPTTRILEIFNEKFGTHLDITKVARDKEERAFAKLDRSEPIGPVVALARQYAGVLPMAVASGGVAANVGLTLEALGITALFDAILAAEDAPRGKPHPDIFLAAAERLGIAPHLCMVLEDSPLGIEAAQAASMHAVDVNSYV